VNNGKMLVPFGMNCSVTQYLRKVNKRIKAFPFDWNITPISSAISLLCGNFSEFLLEKNLIFLPPTNRLLFADNGIDLIRSNEIITPVLDQRYGILLPHDFSCQGKGELSLVKDKYRRRVNRLKGLLKKPDRIVLVYNTAKLNDWQFSQYKLAGVEPPVVCYEDIDSKLEDLSDVYEGITVISLESLKNYSSLDMFVSPKRPLQAIKRFYKKNITKIID
jgi:hypothetical protein